jgi:hypothetical protein
LPVAKPPLRTCTPECDSFQTLTSSRVVDGSEATREGTQVTKPRVCDLVEPREHSHRMEQSGAGGRDHEAMLSGSGGEAAAVATDVDEWQPQLDLEVSMYPMLDCESSTRREERNREYSSKEKKWRTRRGE